MSSEAALSVSGGSSRGLTESGRGWKSIQTVRSSSMKRPKTMGSCGKGQTSNAFRASKGMKLARDAARRLAKSIADERQAELDAVKERRKAKRARKASHASSGAHLQTINPTKIKRMTKKQLRTIRKTQVDKEGNVQLVPAYGSMKLK